MSPYVNPIVGLIIGLQTGNLKNVSRQKHSGRLKNGKRRNKLHWIKSKNIVILLSNPKKTAKKCRKFGISWLYSPIQTRFFSPKPKQICLSFTGFPISFISFSYRALTYLSSVAVTLPCMYYIKRIC